MGATFGEYSISAIVWQVSRDFCDVSRKLSNSLGFHETPAKCRRVSANHEDSAAFHEKHENSWKSAKSCVGPHALQVSKNTAAQPYGERRCPLQFFCSGRAARKSSAAVDSGACCTAAGPSGPPREPFASPRVFPRRGSACGRAGAAYHFCKRSERRSNNALHAVSDDHHAEVLRLNRYRDKDS